MTHIWGALQFGLNKFRLWIWNILIGYLNLVNKKYKKPITYYVYDLRFVSKTVVWPLQLGVQKGLKQF